MFADFVINHIVFQIGSDESNPVRWHGWLI